MKSFLKYFEPVTPSVETVEAADRQVDTVGVASSNLSPAKAGERAGIRDEHSSSLSATELKSVLAAATDNNRWMAAQAEWVKAYQNTRKCSDKAAVNQFYELVKRAGLRKPQTAEQKVAAIKKAAQRAASAPKTAPKTTSEPKASPAVSTPSAAPKVTDAPKAEAAPKVTAKAEPKVPATVEPKVPVKAEPKVDKQTAQMLALWNKATDKGLMLKVMQLLLEEKHEAILDVLANAQMEA